MMAAYTFAWLLLASFARLASAHFIMNVPTPLGNNIDNENIAPCGGFTPSASDNITNFHVGGDAIGLTTLHAQSFFGYFGMLGTSLTSPNWTTLIPTVEEFGLNSFCQPSISIPSSWAGQAGLLQVIQDSDDGVHYQCMHVNFVTGAGTATSACTNSSGVSANFASDSGIATADNGNPTASSSSGQASNTATMTSSAAQSTASKSAAHRIILAKVLVGTPLLPGLLATWVLL